MPRQSKTDPKFAQIKEQIRRIAQNSEQFQTSSASDLKELSAALDDYSAVKLYADWAGEQVGKLVSDLLSVGLVLLLTEKHQTVKKIESSDISGSQKLLKADQVAKYLGVSRSKVYQMMQTGELPMVRMSGAVRVRVQDLEEFIFR